MIKKIKVLIVDDSVVYRKIMTDILSNFSEIEIVGTAVNGKIALEKIDSQKPDLITLDIEMPVLDGIEVLRALREKGSDLKVIVVSALTVRGAKATIQAMELGAQTFFTKPSGGSIVESKQILLDQIRPVIKGAISNIKIRSVLSGQSSLSLFSHQTKAKPSTTSVSARMKKITGKVHPEIVAIGISTGGPAALINVLTQIPATFKVPIVIVQHMPVLFTKALADSLDRKCDLTVSEASDGQIIERGNVYIAPGGKQMKLVRSGNNQVCINITDDPPENHCKPAADYLFRSVSTVYGSHAIGVIMTGMGRDGTNGLLKMKQMGAVVIAQSEASCVVFGMPMEAINAGAVDSVLADTEIAGGIMKLVY